jgi:hypothetical protein
MRLEDLEKQTKKETIKEAHAAIIAAEKIGVNADQLREMLVEVNNWDGIVTVTKDLKAKVELEAMKAQVKADIKQDMSQELNQTINQNSEASSMPEQDTWSRLNGDTASPTIPFVETVVVTAGAAKN